MQMVLKRSPWSCILSSFAMALNVSPRLLIRFVGHDGGEVVFPDLPQPMCRRGFHIQELIQLAWHMGYNVTPIELLPVIGSADGKDTIVVGELNSRFEYLMALVANNQGVMTGRGHSCHHAVAFCNGEIFDPEGLRYPFNREQCETHHFYPNCIWIVTQRDNPPTK